MSKNSKIQYNKRYQKNSKYWGDKPSFLFNLIKEDVKKKKTFLDLGCGQGRDLFYASDIGLSSFGIDDSPMAIKTINERVKKENLKNVQSQVASIDKFVIPFNEFDIIQCLNTLNFLPKNAVLNTITSIKKNIKPLGFIIISVFTKDDLAYSSKSKSSFRYFFNAQELLKLFSDFRIIFYFEYTLPEESHQGQEVPHKHSVARIVAHKI